MWYSVICATENDAMWCDCATRPCNRLQITGKFVESSYNY